MNNLALRSLSQIFSPSFFKRIVIYNDTSSLDYKVRKLVKDIENKTYGDIIKNIYLQLEKNYKSEYVYKNTLLIKNLLNKYSLKNTVLLNEFRIDNSIADFVLLNGEVKLFEIKTDLDNFDKLEKQVSDYKKFANKIYIVVSSKNLNKTLSIFNNTNIGIIEFTNRNSIKVFKEAGDDKSYLCLETIFKTLRKKEYEEVIKDFFGYVPNVPNTLIYKECLKLAREIEIETFHNLAFNKLKERNIKEPKILTSDIVPFELKHICYSLDLNEKGYDNLTKILNTNFC
jgi:hypothetical protein